MKIGVRSTNDPVIMAGFDPEELTSHSLKDGTTYDTIVAEMRAAMIALGIELASDPLWASLVSFTDELTVEYAVGAASYMEDFTEYARGDTQRSEGTGHMLPIHQFEHMMGWTWLYLRDAKMTTIRRDIRNGVNAVRNSWRKAILTRLLKRGDDAGKKNGLGTSGLSAGFATDAANTGVDFTPPQYAGNKFDNTHEHYVATNGGWSVDVFTDAEAELKEHGLSAPFDFIISPADELAIKALGETATGANDGFIPVAKSIVAYGDNQNLAKLPLETGNGWYYIGTIGNFQMRVVHGMPAGYGFGWKSYGLIDPMNPMKIRLREGEDPQPVLMTEPNSTGMDPFQNMMIFFEFGVGVEFRTNGTTRKVNGATWTDGTAT